MLPDRAAVTVVLLDYDGGEKLLRCVRSLREQIILPERVLVVDNGGHAFDESALRFAFGPRYQGLLEFARLEKNLGYAGGMNRGLERVLVDEDTSPWVMTLSNDTELERDFFERLDVALEGVGGTVGMLAPKVRAMGDRERLDGAGIGVSLDGMSTARGQRQPDEGQFDSGTHILMPNGVAAIYRRELLEEVGLLDERFWAYCEDTDLGLRAWLAGWDCRFLADCVLYHERSSTLGEHSLKKLYLVERNHYWVAVKNLPLPLLLLNPAFSAYRYAVQAYALVSRKGQGRGFGESHPPWRLAATTLRGMVDAGLGLPHAVSARLAQRRLRRRTLLETIYTLWRKRLPFEELILS